MAEEEVKKLFLPIKGTGGWQSLLLNIQQNIYNNILRYDDPSRERIINYSGMAPSGFRDRILPIVEKIFKESP